MERIEVVEAGICLTEMREAEEARDNFINEKLGFWSFLFLNKYSARLGKGGRFFSVTLMLLMIYLLINCYTDFELDYFFLNLSLLFVLSALLIFMTSARVGLEKKFSREYPELAEKMNI
ncbi:MAG: hypothetical protein PHZ04_05500 [Patescibacteria group bacterium]|nr:hypothetical protein [Patescibacteria group bacterium]MDD5294494.1 hypothetical protein [Patescibacteria group bacterium]MDD5554336.1 hypothetical protein [Patescibacteria group bacterium]